MFPRWIVWLFLGFLAYVLYLGNFSGVQQEPAAVPSKESAALENTKKYPKLAEFTDKDRWLRTMNPDYLGPARWREIRQGEGEAAVCGAPLKVKISGLAAKEETRSFTLGNAPYPVLNEALMGIRPGGVREVSAPPDKVYKRPAKDAKRMVDFTVERVAEEVPAHK